MRKLAAQLGLTNLIIIILLAAPLLAHMYNGHFSRLMTDDYCTTVIGLKYGAIGGALHWYNAWTGLYTNFTIKSLIAPLGVRFTGFVPAIIIILWFFTMLWAVYPFCRLLRLRQPVIVTILLSLILVYAGINGAPAVIQSVYWLAGVIPYISPLILLTLYIGIFIRSLTGTQQNRIPLVPMIAGLILTFLIGGFSEIYLTFQIAALGIAVILSLAFLPSHLKRPTLSILIASLVGAGIAFFLVTTAPGLAVRQARFPRNLTFFELIGQTLTYSFGFLAGAIAVLAPLVLLSTLCLFAWVMFRFRPDKLPFRLYPSRTRWLFALSFGIAVVLVIATIAPGVYAVSGPPPGRVYILPTLILACTAAFWGSLMGLSLRGQSNQATNTRPVGWMILLILALILGPVASTIKALSLAPKLSEYAAAWDQQDQHIRKLAAQNAGDLVIEPLSVDLAVMVGLDPVGSDAQNSTNKCAAEYYGVKTLVAHQELETQ